MASSAGLEKAPLGQLLPMSHSQGSVVSHINQATLDTMASNWSHLKPEYNLGGTTVHVDSCTPLFKTGEIQNVLARMLPSSCLYINKKPHWRQSWKSFCSPKAPLKMAAGKAVV